MKFIPVQSYANYIDAHIIMGRMKDGGIDCWLKDENTVTIDPILTNAVGGIKLMVAENQAGEAARILASMLADIKIKLCCPSCGSHNVEYVTTPRKPGNWFSVLFGFLSFSYAMPVEKVNHCFDCGFEADTPLTPDRN